MKLAFFVLAACTCAWVNAPLETPLPAPPPPPLPPPDVLDGEAQGSLGGEALDELVGAADVVADVEALGDAVAVGDAASGFDLRSVRSRLADDGDVDAPGDAEAVAGSDPASVGDADDEGESALVNWQNNDCNEGAEPDGEVDGDGEAAGAPEPESEATATAAGVNITASAATDSPVVSRFIAKPPRRVT